MATKQKRSRSLTNELTSLSQVLAQAGQIASSLQELHEADMREAVSDLNSKLQKLEHQLAMFQTASELPHQNLEADSSFLRLQAQNSNSSLRQCFAEPLPDGFVETEKSPGDPPQKKAGKRERSVVRFQKINSSFGHCFAKPVEEEPVAGLIRAEKRLCDTSEAAKFIRETRKREDDLPEAEMKSIASDDEDELKRVAAALPKAFELPKILPPGALRHAWEDAKQDAIMQMQAKCDFRIVNQRQDLLGLNRKTFGQTFISTISKGSEMMNVLVNCGQCLHACACGVLSPVGPIRFFWNAMSLFFIAYDLLMVPMQAFKLEDVKGLQVFEWILTIWWTLDVFMTFKTGYIVGSRVEMRPKQIAIHYAKTWLLIDVIIVVLEWVNRFAVAIGSASLLRSSRTLRTFRFLKLFRVTKMKEFGKVLQEQINSNILHLCITLTILGCILMLIIHVTACLWYAVGGSSNDGWLTYDAYEGNKDQLFWYIASVRWVVSQFNGRTDMNENQNMMERFFTCTVGVTLAVAVHAIFISIVTKTMLDLSEIVSSKTRRTRNVNEYLAANPLPPILTSQVKRCLIDYQDVTQELKRENEVLAILPRHVQIHILYEVRSPVLVRHHFFNGLRHESPGVMRLACWQGVQTVSASKDEVVFDKGDECDRMLFTDKLTGEYGQPAGAALSDFHGHIGESLDDALISREAMSELMKSQTIRTHRTHTLENKKTASLDHMKSHTDLLEYSLGFEPKHVASGSWISEAALWIEWENQGRFVANGHGVLIAVQASKLAPVMKNHPDIFALAVIYAKTIALEIASRAELSDILPFEVHLHSPLCVMVTVVSAKGLRNSDFLGKSDPYCLCKVIGAAGKFSEVRFKTEAIGNTLDPVWNHTAEVLLSRYQLLEFQVRDHDFASKDAYLGSARLDPDDFHLLGGFEGDLDLVNSKGQTQGLVNVKVVVMDMEMERKGTISLLDH